MDIVDSYPVVVTEQLHQCRDFYTRWLSFEVLFEATWFVLVSSGPVSVRSCTRSILRRLRRPARIPAMAPS